MDTQTAPALQCEQAHTCQSAVSHIDDSGFLYCAHHGKARQAYRRCRKLRPAELKRLTAGGTVSKY